MKKLCKLARGFKAQRPKRMATCNRVTSPQNLKYQLTQHSLKLNVEEATICTAAQQTHNFATVQAHFTSSEEVSRLCTLRYFCYAQQSSMAHCTFLSIPRYWCQLLGVSLVTSLIPTTTSPTLPCYPHYINLQVTIRTSDLARCTQSTDCASHTHTYTGDQQCCAQHNLQQTSQKCSDQRSERIGSPKVAKWMGLFKQRSLNKILFSKSKDRLPKRLQIYFNLSTIVIGHGKLRAYRHRFKISEDPMCSCKMNPQTTDHLIWECALLSKQRQSLKHNITKAGRRWPITNHELANKYTHLFLKFVNTINFETL